MAPSAGLRANIGLRASCASGIRLGKYLRMAKQLGSVSTERACCGASPATNSPYERGIRPIQRSCAVTGRLAALHVAAPRTRLAASLLVARPGLPPGCIPDVPTTPAATGAVSVRDCRGPAWSKGRPPAARQRSPPVISADRLRAPRVRADVPSESNLRRPSPSPCAELAKWLKAHGTHGGSYRGNQTIALRVDLPHRTTACRPRPIRFPAQLRHMRVHDIPGPTQKRLQGSVDRPSPRIFRPQFLQLIVVQKHAGEVRPVGRDRQPRRCSPSWRTSMTSDRR